MMHTIVNLFRSRWAISIPVTALAFVGRADVSITPWVERVVKKVPFDPSKQFWCLGVFVVGVVLGLIVWIGCRKKVCIKRRIVLELIISAAALACYIFIVEHVRDRRYHTPRLQGNMERIREIMEQREQFRHEEALDSTGGNQESSIRD